MAASARLSVQAKALSLLLTVVTPALAAFDASDAGWEGGSVLLELARQRLGRERVEIVSALDFEKLSPSDGILVLHPEVDLDYDQLSAFMRDGGRVALVDDFGAGASLLGRFNIRRIAAPLKPSESLRHNPDLAIALPAVQNVAGHEQGRHPTVQAVDKLITNHPTGFTHPDLTPILIIPAQGEPDTVLALSAVIKPEGRPVGVRSESNPRQGRLLAMGDPSAFINLMLRYPGNRAFAQGIIDYLVEDDSWGGRHGKLYLCANHFDQQGTYRGKEGIFGRIGSFFGDALDLLIKTGREGLPALVSSFLAVFCVMGAAAWALLLAARPYRRPVPRYAVGTPLVAQGGLAGRAAVLAAPTTHRVLALLEVKTALEEGLTHRLGLETGVPLGRLLSEIDRQDALSRQSSEDLKQMLSELHHLERSLMSPRRRWIPAARVKEAAAKSAAFLAEVDQRLGKQP